MYALNRRRNKLKTRVFALQRIDYVLDFCFFGFLCASTTLAIWVALLDVIEFSIKLIWADIRTTSKHCHLISRVWEPFVTLKFQLYDAKDDSQQGYAILKRFKCLLYLMNTRYYSRREDGVSIWYTSYSKAHRIYSNFDQNLNLKKAQYKWD